MVPHSRRQRAGAKCDWLSDVLLIVIVFLFVVVEVVVQIILAIEVVVELVFIIRIVIVLDLVVVSVVFVGEFIEFTQVVIVFHIRSRAFYGKRLQSGAHKAD
jgi:hypothetical protein